MLTEDKESNEDEESKAFLNDYLEDGFQSDFSFGKGTNNSL